MSDGYPTLEHVEACTDVETALRWQLLLPSPTKDAHIRILDAIVAKTRELREVDNDAYVRAHKIITRPIGDWD